MIRPRRIGNVFVDDISIHEQVSISRTEMQRRVMRLQTDKGTDVGLNLDSGIRLKHGDIMQDNDTNIVIYQTPEKVAVVKPHDHKLQTLTLLGHIIGNRHRPIAILDNEIIFPIHADIELELFTRLLGDTICSIEIRKQVFIPEEAADVHEH